MTMARGLPAVWSALFGLPLSGVGVYLYAFQSRYPLVESGPETPPIVGLALVAFGLFVVGLGLYVQFVAAPDAARLGEGERIVDERDPAQRNALGEAVVSLPVLGAGVYLLYFTTRPLAYPTVALALGLYLFSRGIHRYWRNTLTSYTVTNRRVLEEYRFISLVRNEVPLGKVRGVEERRSAWDSLFGLGNVRVRAGGSGELTVSVDGVYDSTEFADVIRDEVRATEGPAEGSPDRSVETAPGEGERDAGDEGGFDPDSSARERTSTADAEPTASSGARGAGGVDGD
jgi:membrane protein YdbS with pleckstrin-like domain